MRYTKEEVTEAREQLLAMLKPGSTVWTVVKHVARSGMSRHISCYVIQGADIRWIDGYVAKVTGYPVDREREALRVGGCGMDRGFEVVYDLGYRLWPKGDGATVTGRNGDTAPETDGGYLLHQRWL